MDDLLFGLRLTVVGMGTVFLLLAFLMGVLYLLGRLDRDPRATAEAPEVEPQALTGAPAEEAEAQPEVRIHAHGLTDDQVAAIALAVTHDAETNRRIAAPETRHFAPGSQLHTSRWVALGRSAPHRPTRRS